MPHSSPILWGGKKCYNENMEEIKLNTTTIYAPHSIYSHYLPMPLSKQ
jgi:hypothetical protein